MISRRIWFLIGLSVLAYALGLALDVTPYLRGPDEWRWPRASTPHWEQAWLVVIAGLVILGCVLILARRLERSPHPRRLLVFGLGSLMLAAPLMQLLMLRTERSNPLDALFVRAVDEVSNGYFTVGQQITDAGDFLRNYPALMPSFPIHPQVHPPGIPLAYWLTQSILKSLPPIAGMLSRLFRQLECNSLDLVLLPDERLAGALAGMLAPTLANMITLACIFRLAQARFGSRAGLYAAALWTIVPSAVLFAGNWSQVYPLFACLTWFAVDAGLARRNIGFFFLAGLITSVATFLELGTAALGLFLALYVLARYIVERRNPLNDWRFLALALIATLVGVSAVWLVYQAVYGVSLNQIVVTMFPIHIGYQFDRLVWMFNHPYEYMVFLGLALAGLLIVASMRTVKMLRNRRSDSSLAVDALSLSFGAGLVVLSIVDPARDETARTWMLLMPFSVVIVSQLLAGPRMHSTSFSLVWGLTSLQLLTMIATLTVMAPALQEAPPRSTLSALPNNLSSVGAEFGGRVRLVGHQLDRSAADHWMLNLYWQTLAPVDHPYAVFNQVVNAQGQIVAQRDSNPQGGELLMTCWRPGELYADEYVIPLAQALPPGAYTLETGLYNTLSGARLPVVGLDGAQADYLVLEQIDIGPASAR
ncbi:MAG TPA: hypothetical protein VJG32_09440 [Anaerolineae bacterium]|nr:hypothetical protein [Anaerolineae bacterium]